ncbi:MAG TPA: anthranilate synthase component I, partial [Fimbriimonadaceae bacterium]|nr:anthranilate synthase component I [Fimbriimonadaceae bacterium]
MIVPSRDEFERMTGRGRRMVIYQDLLADVETPLSAYWKLAAGERFSFLLESVTGGEQLARYSVLGVRPREVLRTKGTQVRRIAQSGDTESTLAEGHDPLHLLEEAMRGHEPLPLPDMPTFVGGAIGLLSYDVVRFFEKLGGGPMDDLKLDDMSMMLCDAVVVFDHARNLLRVMVMAGEGGYDEAVREIEKVVGVLKGPLPPLPNGVYEPHPVSANMDRRTFEATVNRIREYIAAGDGIQMVPSQRLSTQVDAHPLTIYRALRSLNPSPYMFLLRFGDFDLVGASPELLVSLHERTARVRPIAGTRWRGKDADEDRALGEELLADEKERAEHIMLVDLGRNDLGRVCDIGSVKVNDLMVVERYSHVMHIVSDVTGRLSAGRDAYDLLRASFPAGTVSGAPKVRAMQIIDELEPTRRGSYAGAVGFISHTGELDMCIAIRTILLKDGVAHIQAGAGI